VRIFALDGTPMGKLPLPEIAGNTEIETLSDGSVLFDVSTYLRPRYYARWHPDSGKVEETELQQTSPVSFDDAEVVREFAISKDGTKVPINILRRKVTKLDGHNPALLTGYGGYGLSLSPVFLGSVWVCRPWLDRGGIFAFANIRGGGEFGERWHQEGMLTRKQNVFDDFAAAAQHLIDAHYTSHDKLSLRGNSNGGLLMGAMITQHPELARAIVSRVGVYDMLRVELDPNGAYNTAEFGTVKNPEQFKALYAYSLSPCGEGNSVSRSTDAHRRDRSARQSDAVTQVHGGAAMGDKHAHSSDPPPHQQKFRSRLWQRARRTNRRDDR